MKKILEHFVKLYPVWIVMSSIAGFLHPPIYQWFTGAWISWALSLVMLGMGLTLRIADFKRIRTFPGVVILGFVIMYSVMPFAGWLISRLFQLEVGLAIGLILVSCCPGGTASNVIAYIARANVALSVILTMISTLLGIVVKPILCQWLIGQYVPVDGWGIFFTMLQIVLVPVLIGVSINHFFPKLTSKVSTAGPIVAVIAIVFISGSIVAHSAEAVAAHAMHLFAATLLLHITGFTAGYLIPRILRYPIDMVKTISIETGMQNGGLAAVLARNNFPLQPLAAVPAVFSSVVQTIVGGIVGSYWGNRHGNQSITLTASLQPNPAEKK